MSFEAMQIFIWIFMIMGWLGAAVISVASIFGIIKMIKESKKNDRVQSTR